MPSPFLTDAQLRAELRRCQSCETKPCRSGCPASCSPADFIMAARCGEPSDWRRAAAHILSHNPLGSVCGSVCPDSLCMARCSRRALDAAVNIPAIQAAILRKARQLGVLPRVEPLPATGQRVAVVGAGPAGLGAASVLARAGHTVHVLDRARQPGGMARLIPRERLDPEVLAGDVAWLLSLGDVRLVLGKPVALPRDLLSRGYAAVIVAAGLGEPVELDVPGAGRALHWTRVLGSRPPALRGKRVAIVGDGPVAVDCAEAALARGAAHVEIFARRSLSELDLPRRDRGRLFASGLHVSCRVRVAAIRGRGTRVTGLALRKVALPEGQPFHPSRLVDLRHGEHERRDLDTVVLAMGGRPGLRLEPHPRVVYAGDLDSGPSSVVEALASGKRAALAVHELLAGGDLAACPDRTSCADGSGCPKRATCPEWNPSPGSVAPAERGGARGEGAGRAPVGLPVPLTTDFFGREVSSPFLLAAGPLTAGYAQLKRAYEAGWAGGVLRSGDLDGLCSVVERLRREFPDRLTIVSAGAPGTGDHDADARVWEASTRKLDGAGAVGVEWSLALDLALAVRAVDRVLAASDPDVPKLFRVELRPSSSRGRGDGGVSGAAAHPMIASIAATLARHPDKLAGVTLTGPLSAAGLPPALFLSADADPMSYRAAATLLALGARNVQVSTVALQHGLGVVNELHAGLSCFLAERGMRSVSELPGSAVAELTREPSREETVCEVDPARCTGCGNCSRCPDLAIALDARGSPVVDPARCTGCARCVEQCPAGALAMVSPRQRGARPEGAAAALPPDAASDRRPLT